MTVGSFGPAAKLINPFERTQRLLWLTARKEALAMLHTTPVPALVAVAVHTAAGVRHVTGQTIDKAGLLAVHPELGEAGFTGRWQITNILTGQSIDVRPDSSSWHGHARALARSGH